MKTIRTVVVVSLAMAWAGASAIAAGVVLEAEEAGLHPARVEIVAQDSFRGKKGVSLKRGVESALDDSHAESDLVFTIRAPRAGRYGLTTYAATDALGTEQMRKAKSKFESLFAQIQIDSEHPAGTPAGSRT